MESQVPNRTVLFALLSCLLLAFVAHSTDTKCKPEEYPNTSNNTNATCCPKCRPGYRVKEACGEFTGTMCAPCTQGTYLDSLNGERYCKNCSVCQGTGVVTKKSCSTQSNTICGCDNSHHCVRKNGTSCVECKQNSVCAVGQIIVTHANDTEDTKCQYCGNGTYSPSVNSTECVNHTDCSALGTTVQLLGTTYSDTICKHSLRELSLSSNLGPILGTVLLVLLLLLFIFCFTRWVYKRFDDSENENVEVTAGSTSTSCTSEMEETAV